ncbi:MAG: hypothetical protein JSR98_05485 [Proteobacteria bacterium]|nr:hypothetical protein [Pseudomonadota bacterium]
MNSFELSFGLTSVILGLALTHMANAIRKLLLRGREVTWAPEPVMLAIVVLMMIVSVWMNQFSHNKTALSDALELLNVLRMLTLYFAAGFSLPEPEPCDDPKIDLLTYYDESRRFSFGSLAASLGIFALYNFITSPAEWRTDLSVKALPFTLWVVAMFVRRRWVNLLVLTFAITGTGLQLARIIT